jgi:hypothetical protein
MDYYDSGDDADSEVYGNYYYVQLFIPYATHIPTSVKVKIWKENNPPGDLEVIIVPTWWGVNSDRLYPAVNYVSHCGTGTITAASITHTSSPGDWYECTLSSADYVYAGQMYAILLRQAGHVGDSSNNYHWRRDSSDATHMRSPYNQYSSSYGSSSNQGSSWSISGGDCFMFEEWGKADLGELIYGGNVFRNFIVSNPNASFDIVRIFENACGQPLTVNEVGMHMYGKSMWESSGYWYCGGHIYLIARDIVSPGIALANGEILEVTYTPQITV